MPTHWTHNLCPYQARNIEPAANKPFDATQDRPVEPHSKPICLVLPGQPRAIQPNPNIPILTHDIDLADPG